MTLLDRLMRETRKAMRARGHEPTIKDNAQAKGDTSKRVTVSCKHCNMVADIICKPLPNEIQIGGEAVALNCNVATKSALQRGIEIHQNFEANIRHCPTSELPLHYFNEPEFAIYAVTGC